MTYEYKSLCIEDYSDDVLIASPNPFAAAMLIAKEALLKAEMEDEQDSLLMTQKILMLRLLKKREALFGARKTSALLYFLRNYVLLKKPETIRKFILESHKLSGKKDANMGIIEQVHEIQRNEGRAQGLKEGRKEGLETAVERLLTNTQFTDQEIVKMLDVNLSLVEKVKNRMKKK